MGLSEQTQSVVLMCHSDVHAVRENPLFPHLSLYFRYFSFNPYRLVSFLICPCNNSPVLPIKLLQLLH
jgi:hypothetical protein